MIHKFDKILKPYTNPFVINEDGSSQTELTNHGRLGFFVERLFDIKPNSQSTPDLGQIEIKTVRFGKRISISTMSENEFNFIYKNKKYNFVQSHPYKKMKNTLLIVYDKQDFINPVYNIRSWNLCNLADMDKNTKKILQEDYETICEEISIVKSRDDLTDYLVNNGSISGRYLGLVYKGAGVGGYNYPAWIFTSRFVRCMQQV